MNKKYSILMILLAFSLTGMFAITPFTLGYTTQKLSEYMSSPLPSAPEPVLIGESFPVTVKDLDAGLAGATDPSIWSGYIVSDYGEYPVSVDGVNNEGEWSLSLTVPVGTHPGLYDLSLTQTFNGQSKDITQINSVWVLESWPESLTISHITDIHEPIGEVPFQANILQSNFINPDLCIATGDIVQTESVARSWSYLQYAMENIEYPMYLLPGNHDYSGYGGKGYQMYGGKLNYTLVLGDFLIVALDSAELAYLSDAQLEWLEHQLSLYPNKVKIIGFHHAFLSSEYEEDMGTLTGGYIEADWTRINELADTLYFTWKTDDVPSTQAQNLLRIVQEYDVRLILTGHVHRDMIYVVNDQHYFVTTSTTGGGLPPTSRHGSRLITLNSDGSIELDPYSEEGLTTPPNNIPHGYVTYTYGSANDFSETAVSVHLENDLTMDIDDGHLVFRVSDSEPSSDYVWIGNAPDSYEVTESSDGYVFDAFFDVLAESSMDVTLKAVDDNDAPEASAIIADYTPGSENMVSLTISDDGWGVKTVEASYSIDDGATWNDVDASIEPIHSGDLYDITFPELVFEFEVPAVSPEMSVLVKATATDYAGNAMDFTSENLLSSPKYTLSVSSPVEATISIDGEALSTPLEKEVEAGDYTLIAQVKVTVAGEEYAFVEWSDGVSDNERTIDLDDDLSLELTYEKVVTEEPPVVPDTPEEDTDSGSVIPFPASYSLLGLGLALFLFNQKKIKQF